MSLFSDERPVRESEKTTAKHNFQFKSWEVAEGETGRPKRRPLFGDGGGAKVHLDFNLSNVTDLGKISNQEQSYSDSGKSSSPSKYQSEEHQSYLQPQPDFEDEYRPLPSPTRSSLRSPGPSSRAKEGHHVTFADSTISEVSSKRDDIAKDLRNIDEEDISNTRDPIFTYPDKPGAAFSFKNTYLTSTPVRKEAAGSEKMRAWTLDDEGRTRTGARDGEQMRKDDLDGSERIRAGNLNDIGNSLNLRDPLKSIHNSEESSTERLLRLSSDLYITTHLTDPLPSSSSLSALRKGFNDISKTYTLPPKPTLNSVYLAAKPAGRAEFSRDYKRTWIPERTSMLQLSEIGMKRSNSLNSLSAKPFQEYGDRREDLLKKRENSPNRSETHSISGVLQQLLDLVDRHWNGSGSLLHNQRFLVPARDVLTRLLTSNSTAEMSTGDSAPPPDYRNSHKQPEDGDSIESVKLKLIKVMEENHFLQSKVSKLENQVRRQEGAGNLSQDDLHHKYEQLSLQVESLQQQLNKTHKLQETVSLLHNSQRSLQCTNDYLLQQLNKISPTAMSKPSQPSSPPRIITDKYHLPEPTDMSTPSAAYGPSQYRNPERLSACPL